ncbi:hypothetical protein ABAC460_10565 [Asticcacaulis sp. AC460]|uniref:class II aldolase/adducin family protein n=1 Tax=Asticcacaulis sp. AC460 TaxID=1282360 RepID=UPI0003C3E599|nr:class II aldolase/adducin family protein [Asticcacaulis sp. AC460]ESQ90185.1 hypothetical protein ABAC460_10565 [Asticcacaulis sp. AC460]
MTTVAEDLAAAAADGVRILTLGKALSPARPGVLAQRRADGIAFAELRAGPVPVDAEVPAEAKPLLEAVFAAHSDAGAAVLLRAPRLAAWGLSGRPLPVRYFQMFSYTKTQDLPVADADPAAVAAVLNNRPEAPALLLRDGRVLIWAPNAARAIRLVLSLEEAAYVTGLADRIGGAQDYPQEARDKIYGSLQAQTRADNDTKTYPIVGAPLSDFAVHAKREIDSAVAHLHETNSLSIVGNGNAAKRYGDRFVIGGFEGPLKGGKIAVVVLDHDENVHEGELYYHHEEVLPLYSAILTERPDAKVAIHTHSPHLVAWALAQKALPVTDFPELAAFGLRSIPVTEAAARYDAGPVVDTLRAFPKAPALLHANHGLLAWGDDFASLARLVVALEEAARLQIEAASLTSAKLAEVA